MKGFFRKKKVVPIFIPSDIVTAVVSGIIINLAIDAVRTLIAKSEEEAPVEPVPVYIVEKPQ